jgi:hypothetical protein
VVGQGKTRLVWQWLTLGVVALWGATSPAQEVVRLSDHIAGDSKPVILEADEIATWMEGGKRIVLLRGTVLVEHGVLHARMQEGVVTVDQAGKQTKGITYVEVYGEGAIQVEYGLKSAKGLKAYLDLSTRGEIKFLAHRNKVVQQPQPQDPLYQRYRKEKTPAEQPPPGHIQRTSAQQTSSAPPDPAVLPVQGQPPPTVPGEPGPSGPAQPAGPPPPPAPGPGTTGPEPTPMLPPLPAPNPPPPTPPAPSPNPPSPEAPGTPRAGAPGPATRPSAPGPPRQISIAPRSGQPFQTQTIPLPTGEQALVVTGGVIVTVHNTESIGILDIEADRLVVWTKDNPQQLFSSMRTPQGKTSRDLELYLAGNVEIRQQSGPEVRTLRAEEAYYDVGHNVAVALQADLEFKQPRIPDPMHLRADELLQLSPNKFEAIKAAIFASKLPSDPGLTVNVTTATLEDKQVPKRSIFGWPVTSRTTGQPVMVPQRLFHGDDVLLRVEDVPVLYFPFVQGDAHDPLGPIQSISAGYNRIFGLQLSTTLNMYDLLGIDPFPGTRWRADVDYLTNRGPAIGTEYDFAGKDLFGMPSRYDGIVKAYGILDSGTDNLGGGRGPDDNHPEQRGRVLARLNWFDLPEGFTVQTQLALLSDKNFLEQYFKNEFDTDLNQDTFLYIKQQQSNWAWTGLVEPRLRDWVTETEWLPRVDGYLLGQSFFNLFTYNVHGSAAYASLQPTGVPPPPVEETQQKTNTGRFDLWQDLSLPFTLGPIRLVPYVVLDLTQYTQDLTGNDRGRFYGAGGVRGSMPLTRIYPDIQSDLFNLNGINHKIVLSANYYNAQSDTPFTQLPQLDELDDDATDQARRDITPLQPVINPANGVALATSPLFNPQVYAIRRLVDDRIDTLDTIEVLQGDIRQRWQTKRGYPGMEHIVDWMTLEVDASLFPHSKRDNFGETFGIIEYDWTWNIGDRTALVSSGWFDPMDNGGRVFTLGAYFNRPDKTNYFLGYRQIDPVDSKAVTAAVTYIFSPKYGVTASTTYDFGTNQALSNSLVLTRIGSDLQLSFGVTYNALQNVFGVTFELLPNLVAQTNRVPGTTGFGSSLLGR